MRNTYLSALTGLIMALMFLMLPGVLAAWGQEPTATNTVSDLRDNRVALVVGHPFSAIKYARKVKILPDDKQKFIRNERYPSRIARDANGRVMMQVIESDPFPECNHLELLVPPICPVWSVFVIDPTAQTITHWPEGERANHGAIDFPLSEARLEQTVHATAVLPELTPDFSDKDGEVTAANLGNKTIEGIQVQGVRSTLRYSKTESGKTVHLTRIHEVWSTSEMKLVIRVIDGDPNGVATVWGLEKISLAADPANFQPPSSYQLQHRNSDEFIGPDFEYLESWFSK